MEKAKKDKGGKGKDAVGKASSSVTSTKASIVIPASVYQKGTNFYLSIHAKPNSKISMVSGVSDEGVDVNIAAPPKDGEANAELIDFMCGVLEVRKSSLNLDKGGKSRNKLLEISNSGYSDLQELYQALLKAVEK